MSLKTKAGLSTAMLESRRCSISVADFKIALGLELHNSTLIIYTTIIYIIN